MENKESYEVLGNSLMVADNESDSVRNVFELYECVDLLNEQSIRIKELEAEVVYQKNYVREEWKTQNNFLNENKQLKQQLEEKDNRIKELEQQCLDLKEGIDFLIKLIGLSFDKYTKLSDLLYSLHAGHVCYSFS